MWRNSIFFSCCSTTRWGGVGGVCGEIHDYRHTVFLSSEGSLLCPLCAGCPWASVCKLTLGHLYLVPLETHTHCFTETVTWAPSHVTLHTGWLTHVPVMTVVNLRQVEGMTAAGRLGSEWKAGIGSCRLRPPISATVNARRSLISDLLLCSVFSRPPRPSVAN